MTLEYSLEQFYHTLAYLYVAIECACCFCHLRNLRSKKMSTFTISNVNNPSCQVSPALQTVC